MIIKEDEKGDIFVLEDDDNDGIYEKEIAASEEKEKYTITFNSNGGTEITSQTIKENEKATKPTDPTKAGYNFTGWYLNGVLYDFDTPVTADITLEAGWVEQGTVTAPSPSVASGTAVKAGTELVLTSEDEAKIYNTTDGTEPTADSKLYENPIIITADTTIKAFAVKDGMKNSDVVTFTYTLFVVYTVSFNSNGGTEVKEQLVEKDGKAKEPSKPVKDGFKFAGWYLDGQPYDFTSVITADITLEAKWTEDGDNDEESDVLPEDIPETGIPDGLWIASIKPVEYTGKAIKPEVHVYDGKRRLKEKTDYTVSYKNNTKANDASNETTAPTVIVTGKKNYAGKETAVFEIKQIDLNDISIETDDIVLAFNNKTQKPVPTVLWNNKMLKNKTEFTVSYPDDAKAGAYKESGEYNIRIAGKGNFKGERVVKLVITQSTLISKASVKKIPDQRYMNGANIEPVINVTYKGKALIKDTDYTVLFRKNKDIGTANAIIKGINNFAGSKTVTFKIVGNPFKAGNIIINGIGNRVFTGEAHTMNLQITNKNGVLLKENVNYEVEYKNNTNVGTAQVILTGINDYSGSIKKTFRITAADIRSVSGLDTKISVKYVKGGAKPEPVLSFNGMKLKAGTDFTVTYKNNKVVSDSKPVMVIKGKGNYKGTVNRNFSIAGKRLDDRDLPVDISVSDIAFANRAGKYVSKPVIKDTDGTELKAGVDYEKNITYMLEDGTVLDNKSIVSADTRIKVIVTGKGVYEGGQLETTYRITKSDFSKASISIAPQIYSGEAIYLNHDSFNKVKIGNTDITANYGTDYEIVAGSYKNNISTGMASVVIRGKGNYGGIKTVNFKIKSKGLMWWWRSK